MSAPRRWPLHPPPAPGEALSSWLARVAGLYRLPPQDLLRHNLGPASALPGDPAAADLDWDPPAAVLAALDERTGAGLPELQRMTIAGWVPWLLDTLEPGGQVAFDTYVRQHSVLLAPGEAGRNGVPQWRPWIAAHPAARRAGRRVCPVCWTEPGRGVALTARLPIMLSCGEHGCRLESEIPVRLAIVQGEPAPGRPVPAPVAAMDRLTGEGLTTGRVTLPGRGANVAVWFRLLRTLLDEVSMAPSRVGARSRAALEQIWHATGRPVRAGLNVWRPYEQLGWPCQEAMLEAAATALHLAGTGAITARGTLGPLLARKPHRPVYEGDRPAAAEVARARWHADMVSSWRRAEEELNAMLEAARSDPAVARHVLVMLTVGCRTPESFNRERQYLAGLGIPAAFLPGPGETGRLYLAADPP
jgi:hypothetical protein